MKAKRCGGTEAQKRFVVVLSTGDEVSAALKEFAGAQRLTGHFTAVGAVQRATIAFWDPATREYRNTEMPQQMEVLALTGNIATTRGAPKIHAHITFGLPDGRAVGGHLVQAWVRPTVEIFFTEAVPALERAKDEQTGLDLLKL
jgi:predicted DNA-binding protein with PD1-like motif